MIPKNIGELDAAIRACLAVILLVVGLFVLDGQNGNFAGIVVALLAAIPAYMVLTRRCIVFHWLGISSRKHDE